ncbi:MAG: sigma-70 family RNA polymerase sigma factor [Muribaculum sp.]|nr:sigma-70 family RNA polymerase sigma factor [Muribaculum sp.]
MPQPCSHSSFSPSIDISFMETIDDAELVKRSQSGDRDAMGILYNTYLAPMRDVIRRYVHNPDTANDILHDGFIIAITSIGSLRNGASIEAWLTTIMRNLSLQHIKDTANCVAVSDVITSDETEEQAEKGTEDLSWEELERIINRLPEGYGRIFRLAVLDGMSHKEIGAMLGIAPHSSSSQLTHAKAMLRRLITQYRTEMGILSTAAIALLWWNLMSRHQEPAVTAITLPTARQVEPIHGDRNTPANTTREPIYSSSTPVYYTPVIAPDISEDCVKGDIQPTDSATDILHIDTPPHSDTTRLKFNPGISPIDQIAQNTAPSTEPKEHNWSVSLTYTSQFSLASGYYDNELNEVPAGPTDSEPEHVIRHMPIVAGVSVSRRLDNRWSIESGIHYTYMRTDTKTKYQKSSEHTHYIGVPIKVNYRIVSVGGCSIYGQSGAEIDIPVKHRISVSDSQPDNSIPSVKNTRITPPVQWSAGGGIGIQYNLSPRVSIYAEPSVIYYFNAGSDIQTTHQRGPIGFNMPVGLRMTW